MKITGGYYIVNKAESNLPFHLIGLNTNIYYRSNGLVAPDDFDPLGQFEWLKDILTECQVKGEKAFIFGHISPGKFERYRVRPPKWEKSDNIFNMAKFIENSILEDFL